MVLCICDHSQYYQSSNSGVGCLILWRDGGGCHGDCISPILIIGRCKGDLSSLFGSLARILLKLVTIWRIKGRQLYSCGSCQFF
jgi:hypothetical protein